MKVSSVSPLRWLAITPQPATLLIFTASMDSVTLPIWFTCGVQGSSTQGQGGRLHSRRLQRLKHTTQEDAHATGTQPAPHKGAWSHRCGNVGGASDCMSGVQTALRMQLLLHSAGTVVVNAAHAERGGSHAMPTVPFLLTPHPTPPPRLTLSSSALAASAAMAFLMRAGLVTSWSSPTIWQLGSSLVMAFQLSQSSCS